MQPVIDPSIQTYIALFLGSGVIIKLLDIAYDRWKTARGKKKDAAQVIAEYREALARARFMLSERGVPEEQLPDYPT